MNANLLHEIILQRNSFLCIGLDPDLTKIPQHLLEEDDPIFAFNKEIIDSTRDLCVAYKPNIAFYEANGTKGWEALVKTVDYIGDKHFKIADAKRADIGNTSKMYAHAFFENMDFDAITVAPYMGADSITPFLEYEDKWVILLALTSNLGSRDFQYLTVDGMKIYESVVTKALEWSTPEQLMFVVGATHPRELGQIRRLAPDSWFLIPGVGAQGGDLEQIIEQGANNKIGILVNSSRSILYAGSGQDFADKARLEAQKLQNTMSVHIDRLRDQ